MNERDGEQDELLLMRHLEGRLSPAETAALKARLAAEPALQEKLDALDLENDLIAGAVSVPDDVELPEPVMMAIIDQALKDPKRQAAGRTWWKPVTLSLGAAAAVVLAVLTSFLLTAEKQANLEVVAVVPELGALKAMQIEPGSGGQPIPTLLTHGAQIRAGCRLTGAGGTASVVLLQGVTLNFDSDTELVVGAIKPGEEAGFVLQNGAVMVDYYPTPNSGFKAITLTTADNQLTVRLERGRTLVLPVANPAASGSTLYLVYQPEGQAQLTLGPAGKPVALAEGAQALVPNGNLPVRTVAGQALMRDLLCGWQYPPAHATGAWWNGELRYDHLDRAWPLELARQVADDLHAPTFLTQAQGLSDDQDLIPQTETAVESFRHWMAMSNTLDDRLTRSQVTTVQAWNLLAFKANRMALLQAAAAPAGQLSPLATEPARERMAAAFKWLEDKAAQQNGDARLEEAINWLRIENDFTGQKMERNEAARYQAFSQQYPTALESLSAQLRRAELAPAGDPRLSQLNLAWQDCHQFAVRMRTALASADKREERRRLAQLQVEIMAAFSSELAARGQYREALAIGQLPLYLHLPQQIAVADDPALAQLGDRLVATATAAAQAELKAGRPDAAEALLLAHQPSGLATLGTLEFPIPHQNTGTPLPGIGMNSMAVLRPWMRTYLQMLQQRSTPEDQAWAAQLETKGWSLEPEVTPKPEAVEPAATPGSAPDEQSAPAAP